MRLWLLEQDDVRGYDTYDSCIVAARTEDEARRIHPSSGDPDAHPCGRWTEDPSKIVVTQIGVAVRGLKAGVWCASFNAG